MYIRIESGLVAPKAATYGSQTMAQPVVDPQRVAQMNENPWNTDTPYDYSTMWLGTKLCQEYITHKTSGIRGEHWLKYAIGNYVLRRPNLGKCRALVLGASEGFAERELCSHGFSGEIVATDIADRALARARKRSEELGLCNIRHVLHDLN